MMINQWVSAVSFPLRKRSRCPLAKNSQWTGLFTVTIQTFTNNRGFLWPEKFQKTMGYHPQQWWILPQKLGSSTQEFPVLIPRTTSIPVPQATRCWPSGLRSAARTEATSLRPQKAFPRSSWLRCCFFDLLWTTYGVNSVAIESFRLKLGLGCITLYHIVSIALGVFVKPKHLKKMSSEMADQAFFF